MVKRLLFQFHFVKSTQIAKNNLNKVQRKIDIVKCFKVFTMVFVLVPLLIIFTVRHKENANHHQDTLKSKTQGCGELCS
ncbi:MAG: hypothetical protein DRP96_06415 [Candidatus Neomarinimicrobiota bacterium]|nr:MAG: hypothetical protein DRP96_06415 [Candidatus Neomarinimicrobiota bacterium]